MASPTSSSLSYIAAVSMWRYPLAMAAVTAVVHSLPRRPVAATLFQTPRPRMGML